MTNPRITRLLMRICATRLDSSVSADNFVEQLEELLDVAMAPVIVKAQEKVPAQPLRACPDAPPREAVLIKPHSIEGEKINKAETLPPPASPAAPPRRSKNPRLKISYDNRVRIRMQADKALEENGGRMPRGFVSNLAGEWNVSDQTIYNVLNGEK